MEQVWGEAVLGTEQEPDTTGLANCSNEFPYTCNWIDLLQWIDDLFNRAKQAMSEGAGHNPSETQ